MFHIQDPNTSHLWKIIRFTLSLLHTCVFHGVNVEPSKLEVFVLLNLALLLLFYWVFINPHSVTSSVRFPRVSLSLSSFCCQPSSSAQKSSGQHFTQRCQPQKNRNSWRCRYLWGDGKHVPKMLKMWSTHSLSTVDWCSGVEARSSGITANSQLVLLWMP